MPIFIKRVIDFTTTGKSMAEFHVTVNGVDSQIWQAVTGSCADGNKPANEKGAAANNWSLEVCNTWKGHWELKAGDTAITSIEIKTIIDSDGDGNGAVFDVLKPKKEPPSTTGSSNGWVFSDVKLDGVKFPDGNGPDDPELTATYSRPVHLFEEEDRKDLYGVLTLTFVPALGPDETLTFKADTDDVNLPNGCCCLDFDIVGFEGYEGLFPLYLNNDGEDTHILPETVEPEDKGKIEKFLSCYDQRPYRTQLDCEDAIGTLRYVPSFIKGQRRVEAEVKSAHWFMNKDKSNLWCGELQEDGQYPLMVPSGVKLLATNVNLTASNNLDGGVELTLTADSDDKTAAYLIFRDELLPTGETALTPVCNIPSVPHPLCQDNVVGGNYRVFELEYSGRIIMRDSVTPLIK
jgi:hypothetical protein